MEKAWSVLLGFYMTETWFSPARQIICILVKCLWDSNDLGAFEYDLHCHQYKSYQHKITSTDLRKVCNTTHWYVICSITSMLLCNLVLQRRRCEWKPVLKITAHLLANASVKSIQQVQIIDHSHVWHAWFSLLFWEMSLAWILIKLLFIFQFGKNVSTPKLISAVF